MFTKKLTWVLGAIATCATLAAISYSKPSKALDSISQISGECGGVFSMVRKHYVADNGKTVDVMMYINFDTQKISMSSTRLNLPMGYDGIDSSKQITYSTNAPMLNAGFTMVDGPIPKSFKIIPNAGVNLPQILIMPVSSGNTVLIQAADDNIVGVCQKI
jgi:hypothetical protein